MFFEDSLVKINRQFWTKYFSKLYFIYKMEKEKRELRGEQENGKKSDCVDTDDKNSKIMYHNTQTPKTNDYEVDQSINLIAMKSKKEEYKNDHSRNHHRHYKNKTKFIFLNIILFIIIVICGVKVLRFNNAKSNYLYTAVITFEPTKNCIAFYRYLNETQLPLDFLHQSNSFFFSSFKQNNKLIIAINKTTKKKQTNTKLDHHATYLIIALFPVYLYLKTKLQPTNWKKAFIHLSTHSSII